MVARDGIEPSTRGFSVRIENRPKRLIINKTGAATVEYSNDFALLKHLTCLDRRYRYSTAVDWASRPLMQKALGNVPTGQTLKSLVV
jgi:hypothetical protein